MSLPRGDSQQGTGSDLEPSVPAAAQQLDTVIPPLSLQAEEQASQLTSIQEAPEKAQATSEVHVRHKFLPALRAGERRLLSFCISCHQEAQVSVIGILIESKKKILRPCSEAVPCVLNEKIIFVQALQSVVPISPASAPPTQVPEAKPTSEPGKSAAVKETPVTGSQGIDVMLSLREQLLKQQAASTAAASQVLLPGISACSNFKSQGAVCLDKCPHGYLFSLHKTLWSYCRRHR